MAAGGADLKEPFGKFATKGGGKECTTKDVTRWCTDAGGVFGKNCNSNHLDICFSKVKTKGKTTITYDQVDALCSELGKMYMKDHKCDESAAKTAIKDKLAAASPKGHGTTGTSKVGGVDRMTDASKYTGAHKERFGEDGKGKGIDGREDKVDSKGYVGNYKGEGSYAKKK